MRVSSTRERTDASERILTAQQTIDRQLVDTKGRDFVERMRASLPKIYQTDSSEKVTAADSEEATKTICECRAHG